METPLREFCRLKELADVNLALNPVNDAPPTTDAPIFFYHMQKAGGIAVHMTLLTASNILRLTQPDLQYLRFHAYDDGIVDAVHTLDPSTPIAAVCYAGMNHLSTFGMHERFRRPFNLVTVLRDPFDRVVSHYFYEKRRDYRPGPAGEADFTAFAGAWDKTNYFCKQLAGAEHWSESDTAIFEAARRNLATFYVADVIENLERFLLCIWQAYGFPTVLSEKIHANPYKKQSFEHLREPFRTANALDYALVDELRAQPIYPADVSLECDEKARLSDIVGLVLDTHGDEEARVESALAAANDFVTSCTTRRGPGLRDVLERLNELMPDGVNSR